jgi:hypothetical protein
MKPAIDWVGEEGPPLVSWFDRCRRAQYVGVYDAPALPGGEVVSLEGSRLVLDPGAGKIPFFVLSENSFTMEGTGVEFVKDEKGTVPTMVQSWTEGDRFFPGRK